jgi:glyoxylase-like metal-dependent hydrolase (beta-lactamase superfamily II)
MIESEIWQNIPGTAAVQLYPIVRKPSIISSSSFIFRTPSEIVILDPGGDPEQVEHIEAVVKQALMEEDLPVIVCLTHTHIDHFYAMPRLLGEPVRGRVFCHPHSGNVLQDQDAHHSLAYLYGFRAPRCDVYVWLFNDLSRPGEPGMCEKNSLRAKAPEIKLPAGSFGPSKDSPLPTDVLKLGSQDMMEIFHTPGHSQDSLSFRIGEYLFVGDVPFAAEPGVAGVGGWSSEALFKSVHGIDAILENSDISLVIPGHGIPWPVPQARRILGKVGEKLSHLGDIQTLDRERLDHLLHYAEVLLEEAGAIFSILAGRLLKVHYYLDQLGEEDAARSIMQLIELDKADRIIHDFYAFMEDVKGSGLKGLTLQKAIHFVSSLSSAFKAEGLDYLVGSSFLRRTRALFTDFINAVNGRSFHDQETVFNLSEGVRKAVASVAENPFNEQAFFDSVDNDEIFIRELSARIAHNYLFDEVALDFHSGPEDVFVSLEPAVIEDILISLFEEMAAGGCRHLEIRLEHKSENVFLLVDARGNPGFELSGPKEEYLRLTMAHKGVPFRKEPEYGRACFGFQFRPV